MISNRMLRGIDLSIAPLALGGNVFGWTADEASSFRLLDAFVDAGGTMIDSADVYSAWAPGNKGGESETVIGRWLKRDPGKRAKVVIATKVGFLDGHIEPVSYNGNVTGGEYVAALHPKVIARAADASLARLGIETIDLYYQHRDNPEVPLVDSLGAFEALRQAGKIRATGLSNFEPPRVAEALRVAEEQEFAPAVAVQGWYNLLEREKYEGALQEVVTANDLGFFSFYSLANGFLAGKYRSEEDLGKSVRGTRNIAYLESARGKAVLQALDAIAGETGAAPASVALAWTMRRPGVIAPIASATSLAQLDELLAALRLELSSAQIAELDRASA